MKVLFAMVLLCLFGMLQTEARAQSEEASCNNESCLLDHRRNSDLGLFSQSLHSTTCIDYHSFMKRYNQKIETSAIQRMYGLPSLTDNGQRLGRYAESTIASDISKIMDSMVQKNFVNFLLNQREKKSEPATPEEDPVARQYNDLRKLTLCMRNKGDRSLPQ